MSTTFRTLGVPPAIADALERQGITTPFPIQAATIPPALEGRDLCGKAPTGSGKTMAFGVPMVARVTRSAPKRPHGLVLAPTRELAIQVAEALDAISGDLRVLAVYGGANITTQIKKVRAGIDIVVATPGRLIDLLDRQVCDLRDVTFAVVDEADRMADMGFLPDVCRILDQTRDDRQTVLFSATLDGAIDALVRRYQHDPVVHEFHGEPSGDITHHFWLSERPERVALLAQVVDRLGPTVVFCRTKHGSDRVARQLGNAGVSAVAIHGNRSQAQRERALEAFHRGQVRALVATDVAARGIHVEGVLGVVHYDLPAEPKDYIHRSGRTGRAGSDGTVVTLFDAAQRKDAMKLKKGLGVDVEITAPDVGLLPEGPRPTGRAPRPPRHERDAAPKGAKPTKGAKPAKTAKPEAKAPKASKASTGPKADTRAKAARPGRAERAERSERAERPERSERPERWAEPERGGSSRTNRAARRQGQFTPEERAARAAENERREAQRAASRAASKAASKPGHRKGARPAPAEADGARVLPGDVAGAAKVRPSGASRRKAKREALVAAGEVPTGGKKRRSGKPRPPAPGGRKRRS